MWGESLGFELKHLTGSLMYRTWSLLSSVFSFLCLVCLSLLHALLRRLFYYDSHLASTTCPPLRHSVVDRYAHALLMVAAAVDPEHQRTVAATVAVHNTGFNGGCGTAKHSPAAHKAFARVMTKAGSGADYRYEAVPRAQHNVDVVRCLATAGGLVHALCVCLGTSTPASTPHTALSALFPLE